MSTCLCTRSAHIYWESAECQLENAWFNFVLYAVHLQFSSGDANLVLEMFSKLKFSIEMEKGIRWRFPQSYSGTINCMNFACICLFYLSLHFFPLWLLLKTELEVLFSTDNDFMCVLFCHIVTQHTLDVSFRSHSLSLSLTFLPQRICECHYCVTNKLKLILKCGCIFRQFLFSGAHFFVLFIVRC